MILILECECRLRLTSPFRSLYYRSSQVKNVSSLYHWIDWQLLVYELS